MAVPSLPYLRTGTQCVDVYNEGGVVFLYDEANREHIRASDADFVSGYGEDGKHDPVLITLAEKGLLTAYLLFQDDDIYAAVTIGSPLSAEELEGARWFAPQSSFLSLPSGKLCIESYNSLLLWDEDPTDEGGLVTVPPGDYVLHLYRMDWGGMENAGIEDYQGPYEVILLTPLQEGETPPTGDALLYYPAYR